MLNKISLQGTWRLTVIKKEAAFDQRFVVSGSADADGVHPGTVGTEVKVNGKGQQPWTVTIQHNDGSGWADSELRMTTLHKTAGSQITFVIESEDKPGSSDVDFTDCNLQAKAYEVDMIKVPFRPYAVRMGTLQMMPDGIFETTLGSYYMAVRLQNIWSQTLPKDSRVRISPEGRTMLKAGGIEVVDNWSKDEQEMLGQQISGVWVELGELAPWEMRTIYFKVNCAAAKPGKHVVEFELEQPWKPDATQLKHRTEQKIFVSRSSFNPVTKEFVCECDQGRLFLKLREVAVEYTTLRDAIRCARDHRAKRGDPLEDRARQILQDLLDGNRVDLCELKRLLDRVCAERDERDENGDQDRWPCGDILMLPTKFEYRVEPDPAYVGQFGPLPFDDPWWKALLLVLAIIFTLLAGASAAADLAYHSDEVVIGTLFSSWLKPESSGPYKGKFIVDAALCELNDNRDLPSVNPPLQVLDAQSDEDYTVFVKQLDGAITLQGDYLTNQEIENYTEAYDKQPKDLSAVENALVFKSGARTGLTYAVMRKVLQYPRNDKDGVKRIFNDQILFEPIPIGTPLPPGVPASVIGQAIGRKGDSGSLWIHWKTGKIVALNHGGPTDDSGTHAAGSRIKDVMDKMEIRFTK